MGNFIRSAVALSATTALALSAALSYEPPAPQAVPQAAVAEAGAVVEKDPGRPARGPQVELGVERLLSTELGLLEGKRVGLITNPTGVDRELVSTIDLLIANEERGGYELTALYGPEHGVRGAEPAGAYIPTYIDETTGLPVYSLYGATRKPSPEMLADVDVLVFDIQDIGTRFYTYIWTMYYAMEAAAEQGKEFIVLDRPNPLGPDSEGYVLDESLSTFVGLKAIPQRHGLTAGELAQLFNGEFLATPVDLEVVEMTKYNDQFFADGYGLEWVLPSPNIPTLETAWVYSGTGLIESVNVSEGRGTTTPFLWFGAPFIDEAEVNALVADLNSRELPGVRFRPMYATPSTSKHAGRFSGGVQVHITDPAAYESVRTGIHILEALFDNVEEVDWREGANCRTMAQTCWIDNLSGTKDVRAQLDAGVDAETIVAGWEAELAAFDAMAQQYRIY
ncbi:DUF1343 domain-containing protein [Tessaracoccus sp. OS52]|uniref:exo-beta-N-acetylmuramidase NamZ family protein n=1 Tax=Tessaracoccus sp. OS52 TaxID=2886691 RepID=UPI001D125419|nr:DUF1343 domain-containing protein [Tessaracoccus sp. OS52]MCC2592279.1 DUF1343 domain-containing protein [Tessaracoccus sp. OS52]